MAVRRVKLHKNHPQRIPNMLGCLSTGRADTVLHNMLVAKTSSVILYTFLLVYTSIYISTDTICMSVLYTVSCLLIQSNKTLCNLLVEAVQPLVLAGASMPPPQDQSLVQHPPTLALSSPLKWGSGGITPGNFLNINNHFGAFWYI